MRFGRRFRALTFTALLATTLAGCGSDSSDSPEDSGSEDPTPVSVGVLLSGQPTALAKDTVTDYDSSDRTARGDISADDQGNEFDRTRIQVALKQTATVKAVNELLNSIGGRITNMLDDLAIVVVKIPDPGDLDGLEAVTSVVAADPAVEWVLRADMGGTDQLPANLQPSPSDFPVFDHQVAVLGPAAWNAKAALDYPHAAPPLLLISDLFGHGAPDADFDLNIINPMDFSTSSLSQHGYHVLGIIAGRHDTDATATTPRKQVTGIYPGTLRVRAIDRRQFSRPDSEYEIARRIRGGGNRVVLNTSLHSGCARPPTIACVTLRAIAWLRALRGDSNYFLSRPSVWEDNFLLHLTSSGNFRSHIPDSKDGRLNSQYSAGKMLPGLMSLDGSVAVPNVTNTLVVENRNNTAGSMAPGCLRSSSKLAPGEISAIGGNVFSFTDFAGAGNAGNLSGTSMSTPQVSGLAAYIWALRPTLKPAELVALLRATARNLPGDTGCLVSDGAIPQPSIDAYAAVLATDIPAALSGSASDLLEAAPARIAILDVADAAGNAGADRTFNHHDLNRFVQAFNASSGMRDFSRFDLNGDGFTGGETKATRFNLDIDAANTYAEVEQTIESIQISFDEAALTDLEILCFYAYSPLYVGLSAERTTALASKCVKSPTLYFVSNRTEFEHAAIFSMDSDGGNQTQLTDPGIRDDILPVASPDGTKVLFRRGFDLRVMDADGLNLNQITFTNTDRELDLGWWPDGSKIIYKAGGGIQWKIYSMNADGSGLINLTDVSGPTGIYEDAGPQVSPDGSKIVFWSNRSGNSEIYVMNSDGTNLSNLTNTNAAEALARISPNGEKIAFLTDRDGNDEIYVMDFDGLNAMNLSNSPANDGVPIWSPTGSHIAFHSNRGDGNHLYVMNSDGTNVVKVSNSNFPLGGENEYKWLPNSSKLIYQCVPNGDEDICAVNRDGTGAVNLTNNPAEDYLSGG